MKKVVISLSGGMDSATLLGHQLREEPLTKVLCVGFTYGSKHNAYENLAAAEVARHYGVPLKMIDLSYVFASLIRSDLLKTGGVVPEGHYEAESMRRTVVPGRNLIFASLLAGYAESEGASEVYLGVHSGDHFIYPDCRPQFVLSLRRAVSVSTDGKVDVRAPFQATDKQGILNLGIPLGVPYHLTRTCYKDQPVACGKCGSCQERLDAFAKAGVDDPIPYESRELMPKESNP